MFICSFGCLQRIDFLRGFGNFLLNMGCLGTTSGIPFAGWVRVAFAVLAGSQYHDFIAPLALINNCMTSTPVVSAAFLAHEHALSSDFRRLTNHRYHPSLYFFKIFLWNSYKDSLTKGKDCIYAAAKQSVHHLS
jgi:hypothetical protein